MSGRTKSSVEAVAKEIVAKGGRAHATALDTTDHAAVNQYLDGIVKQTGKIAIILDSAGPLARQHRNGKPAVELPIEEFRVPLATMVKSRFITARQMIQAALGRDHFRDASSPASRHGMSLPQAPVVRHHFSSSIAASAVYDA